MAAPIANDRKLAAEVRRMTLNKIKALFEMPRVDMKDHDAELHDRILEKLAGTVLPRLSEVTGEDGKALVIQIANEVANKHDINASTSNDSQEPEQV